MSRSLLIALAALTVALGACSSDDDHEDRDHGDRDSHGDAHQCSAQPTCGTCTPVAGCGWCDYGGGTGACASHPDACRGESFRWTWEPIGCGVSISGDGGLGGDASRDAPPAREVGSNFDVGTGGETVAEASSEAASEAASDAGATCSAPSAGLGGCVSTTGGTLCTTAQYTLGCHVSGAAPDATLRCKTAASSGGSTYYCCPCPAT